MKSIYYSIPAYTYNKKYDVMHPSCVSRLQALMEGICLTLKKSVILLIVLALLSCFIPGSVFSFEEDDEYSDIEVIRIMNETDMFNLQSKSAILVDSQTGAILYRKNEHEKLPIASVTKVMTMLLMMEAIESGQIKLKDTVSITEYAYGFGGSQVYLEPGEVFTYEELLKAVAIHSANDASVAVAEGIAGGEEEFVRRMNAKAAELNMKNTVFLDCTGLTDDGQYSTAYDIAIMSRELITKYPAVLKYSSTWHDTFRNGTFTLDNRNKLIRFYEGATGLKTGFTLKAGHCISATAKRNNMHLIAVTLSGPDSNTRFAEARKLLNYGFANYELVMMDAKGTVAGKTRVSGGMECEVEVIFKEDSCVLIKKGDKDRIKRDIVLAESINAPFESMTQAGEAVYRIEGVNEPLKRVNLYTKQGVEKASLGNLMKKMISIWFCMAR